MTANQFRAAIDRLSLSQVGAARLVGADPRTGRRWALGEGAVPECVAILLRLLLAGKIKVADIDAAKRGGSHHNKEPISGERPGNR